MERATKIVIIDDNQDYLFTMGTFLKRNGYETLTAENGELGLDLVKKEHPDLVILDVMMETLFSGFEVCKRIKTDDQLKNTPVIGVSAMGDELGVRFDKDRDGEYFRPDAFFEKPVDKEKLLSKIRELLGK